MKKKSLFRDDLWVHLRRTFLIMKLTFIICIFGLVSVSASTYSQISKLTLNLKEVSILEVIQQIESQTDFVVIYKNNVIDQGKKVSLKIEEATVDEILRAVLKDTGVKYEIMKKQIILTPEKNIDVKKPEQGKENEEQPKNPQKNLTGSVTDIKGNPIPGTSVVVKGTTIGTITDGDGKFSLQVPIDTKILVFSFVGFRTQEIENDGLDYFEIVMNESEEEIDEVMVVGYGIQRKASVTGAISQIGTKDLRSSSSASLANALAGRLSGLTSIQSGGGQPGVDDATMYLRGAATTNGTSPLILIDGVPRDNLRTLDPNEVASISVLKDASATALFGVRGANGVIIVTTKRGSSGKMELTLNAEQSFTSFTREPERLHSLEYMALRNEAYLNDGYDDPAFDQVAMAKYANPLMGLSPSDPDYEEQVKIRKYMYPDHDYYREYISRYVPQTRINLNIGGGTDKISYFVNGAYLHQGGNLNTEPKSVLGYDSSVKMDRYSFRANIDYNITKSLKSFLNVGSYLEQVNMPAAWLYGNDTNWMMRDLLYQAKAVLPITPGPTTIAGFRIDPGQIVDPGYMDRSAFEVMNRYGYRNEVRSTLNASYGLDLDLEPLVKGLSLKGMISYDFRAVTAVQGSKMERLYLAQINADTDELSYSVKRSNESLLALSKDVNSNYKINLQGIVNYKRTFNDKHNITGLFLAQRDYWESNSAEIPYNVLGISGRLTYGYDDRYFGEVNIGYNGSEQFAPTKRYGFFPAVSVGWNISNENFMKDVDYITNLKMRASYGKVGNDKIGSSRFLYMDNISMGSGALGSLGLGQDINLGLLGNPNLSWEIAKKYNCGMDIQLLKELNISFDYFNEDRSNILISRGSVPEFQGIKLSNIPKVNMGIVKNSGYEVELSYNKSFSNKLSVMIKGNYSYNHNTVKFIDEPIRNEYYVYRYRRTGYSLGQNWGYKIDYSNGNGYFNSQDELNNFLDKTTYDFGTPRVGDFKYIDMNKDGVINDKDMVPIGYSGIPRESFGLTFSINYKSIDFMAFFQGVGKYSSTYSHQGVYEYFYQGTYFDYHRNAWTAERYANGENITYPALSTKQNTNHVANEFFIMNRSYIRLKNIELGYTISDKIFRNYTIKKIRVFAGAQNLITWDKLKTHDIDPENNDPIGYPVTKMINVGLNMTF